jgi:CheY-like chemotaxis protein
MPQTNRNNAEWFMGQLRVLLVDDVVEMRKFIKNALERCFDDCHVDEASDGLDAKAHMQMLEYDLILCDWGIPGLTGEELLQWARSDQKHKDIPFIIITGYRDKDRLIRALELGVNSYIVKPISIDTLMQKIKAVNKDFVEKK